MPMIHAPGRTGQDSGFTAFVSHLRELRIRLVVSLAAFAAASIVCYLLYDRLVPILTAPFNASPSFANRESLYLTSLVEGFSVRIRISLLAGAVLSLPVLLFNAVAFVFPGLTRKERGVAGTGLAVSFVLALAGFAYGYAAIVPVMVRFFLTPGFVPPGTGVLLGFGKNIFYVLQFLLLTVLTFQLPVLLEILMILKVLRRKAVWSASRFIIVGIFVLAAIVTPPDMVSQLAVALPLTVLFLLTMLVAAVFRFGEEG